MTSDARDAYAVVIPAFNAAATLGEAIGSLRRQSVPPAQIIVVVDGSTDGTAGVARACGADVRVIVQDNAGPGAATTRGLAEVGTPLLAFLDADDLWLPHKAQRQIEDLAANPARDGFCALGRQFRDGTVPTDHDKVQEIWSRSALMIRTENARAVGPVIDPPGRRGDMIDWFARARAASLDIAMLPEVLVLRRIRPDSLSYGRGARDIGYLHVAKAALDRRRARGDAT